MYESDDNEEAIKHIPLKNLPFSDLRVFEYQENPSDNEVHPDNVLIGHLGTFDQVALVGHDKDTGDLVFASSHRNIRKIIADLREFIAMLQEHQEG